MTPINIKISDSISLTAINTDKFKTGMISLMLPLPLTKELSAYNMLLSGVLRRGCEGFASMAALNRRLDELYAATVEIKNSRLGRNEALVFSAEILDNAFADGETNILDGTLEVISQMLLCPILDGEAFRQDVVELEKSNILDAIRAEINNPKAYAADRCAELLHKNDEVFPTIESLLETVERADATSIYRHYLHLLNSSSLDFFYVGSDSTESVCDLIKARFSSFNGARATLSPITAESFTELKEVTEELPVSQGKLSIGFRIGVTAKDEDYFAAVLFNEIFGGSPASKLFMNVREKLGLCYYCSSSYDPYLGNVTVSSGINVADKDAALREIKAQLDDIKQGRISDVELVAAKKAISHWYKQMYDYPFELFAFYSTRTILGINTSPEEYRKKFEAVTPDQIINVARNVTLDTVYFLRGTLSDTDGEMEENEE